ncbi:putative tumor susceptibility protein [Paratrimastix pyriformis]|uniref:Tumor susceptibility protein n=1 Tax=Paratrimastix pyriformis TaxID=342808 RepID=A0ABQ8USY9_9EUKA|nr:putative tumor susceptibility protein [Paratrimastix pyriformis]
MMQIDAVLSQLNFRDKPRVGRDVTFALQRYPTLHPQIETGFRDHQLALTGTIPVPIGAQKYNIPMKLTLSAGYPVASPLVYVIPTASMYIPKHNNVEPDGKVTVPYLSKWSMSCTLLDLIEQLVQVFSQAPPVHSRAAGSQAQPPQQPPLLGTTSIPAAGMTMSGGMGGMGMMPPQQPQWGNPMLQQWGGMNPMPSGMGGMNPMGMGGMGGMNPMPTGGMGGVSRPMVAGMGFSSMGGMTSTPIGGPAMSTGVLGTPPAGANNPSIAALGVPRPAGPYGAHSGPVGNPVEQERLRSLRESLAAKVRARVGAFSSKCTEEHQELSRTAVSITQGASTAQAQLQALQTEKAQLEHNGAILSSKNRELAQWLREHPQPAGGEEVPADVAAMPQDPAARQVVQLEAESQAHTDAIYQLEVAMKQGEMTLDALLKNVRYLAREQFARKAALRRLLGQSPLITPAAQPLAFPPAKAAALAM